MSISSRHGIATSWGTDWQRCSSQRMMPLPSQCCEGRCAAMDATARHSCVRTGGAPLLKRKSRVIKLSRRLMTASDGSSSKSRCTFVRSVCAQKY